MARLSREIGAALLCVGLLFSAALARVTQEKPSASPQKAQKSDKAKSGPDEQKAPDQSKTVTLTGKVTAVSGSNVTILDDQKAEHTVVLTPDTKITKDGKDATVSDVKADDLVTILAKKGDGDSLMAIQIAVS